MLFLLGTWHLDITPAKQKIGQVYISVQSGQMTSFFGVAAAVGIIALPWGVKGAVSSFALNASSPG